MQQKVKLNNVGVQGRNYQLYTTSLFVLFTFNPFEHGIVIHWYDYAYEIRPCAKGLIM